MKDDPTPTPTPTPTPPNPEVRPAIRATTTDPVLAISYYLGDRQKKLAQYARDRVKPETLIRLAVYEFSRSEHLRRCTPESIYASLILAAQIGLEPSGIRGEAYLVPYRGQCTLIPGWRGLVRLALQSRGVKSLYSHVVHERDEFDFRLGTHTEIQHRPSLQEDPGEVVAAYAVARLANGDHDVEVMARRELDHVREVAARGRGGKDGPAYEEWADQMFRKAPIRRLAKRLPLGDDFFLASRLDDQAARGERQTLSAYVDGPVDAEVAVSVTGLDEKLEVRRDR